MTGLVAVPADLAAYLQRDLDQATATLALAGASGLVRRYCGWTISYTDETLTVPGSGYPVLSLPTMHLVEVAAVRLGGTALTPADFSETTAMGYTDYTWITPGQLIRLAGWPRYAPVEVDCTHGYDPVPDDVRLVVLAAAGRMLSNPQHLLAETVGGTSRTYGNRDGAAGLTDLERALLDGLRLP